MRVSTYLNQTILMILNYFGRYVMGRKILLGDDRLWIRLGRYFFIRRYASKYICVGFPACGSIKNKKTIRTLILAKNPKDQNESNSGSNSKRYEW